MISVIDRIFDKTRVGLDRLHCTLITGFTGHVHE